MAKTPTPAVLISSQSIAAGTTARGRLDVSAADGGMLRWKVTNGATPPGAQCEVRILVARKQASMPAAAGEAAGDDNWKIVALQGCGVVANAVTRGSYVFGPEVQYIEVEMTGHTSVAVTGECTGDSYVY